MRNQIMVDFSMSFSLNKYNAIMWRAHSFHGPATAKERIQKETGVWQRRRKRDVAQSLQIIISSSFELVKILVKIDDNIGF